MTENIATETNLKLTTPTDREIATTRVFDAPRGLVFDALTIVKEASLFSHRSCSPRSLSGPAQAFAQLLRRMSRRRFVSSNGI